MDRFSAILAFCACSYQGVYNKKRGFTYRVKPRMIKAIWSDYSSTTEKSSFPTPQRGHTHSSGMSSKAVPGAIPLSGSPTAGS